MLTPQHTTAQTDKNTQNRTQHTPAPRRLPPAPPRSTPGSQRGTVGRLHARAARLRAVVLHLRVELLGRLVFLLLLLLRARLRRALRELLLLQPARALLLAQLDLRYGRCGGGWSTPGLWRFLAVPATGMNAVETGPLRKGHTCMFGWAVAERGGRGARAQRERVPARRCAARLRRARSQS